MKILFNILSQTILGIAFLCASTPFSKSASGEDLRQPIPLVQSVEYHIQKWVHEYNTQIKNEHNKINLSLIENRVEFIAALNSELIFFETIRSIKGLYERDKKNELREQLRYYYGQLRFNIDSFKDFSYYLYRYDETIESLNNDDQMFAYQIKNILNALINSCVMLNATLSPLLIEHYDLRITNMEFESKFLKITKKNLPRSIRPSACAML